MAQQATIPYQSKPHCVLTQRPQHSDDYHTSLVRDCHAHISLRLLGQQGAAAVRAVLGSRDSRSPPPRRAVDLDSKTDKIRRGPRTLFSIPKTYAL